jgi:hypothetical protein
MSVVEPLLAGLRALPEPDRLRKRGNRHPPLIWATTP